LVGAAQPKLKNFGLIDLIRTLAELAGRTLIFEHRLWSTECTPLQTRQARSNDTYSLERR
jgi:hypothetical protein